MSETKSAPWTNIGKVTMGVVVVLAIVGSVFAWIMYFDKPWNSSSSSSTSTTSTDLSKGGTSATTSIIDAAVIDGDDTEFKTSGKSGGRCECRIATRADAGGITNAVVEGRCILINMTAAQATDYMNCSCFGLMSPVPCQLDTTNHKRELVTNTDDVKTKLNGVDALSKLYQTSSYEGDRWQTRTSKSSGNVTVNGKVVTDTVAFVVTEKLLSTSSNLDSLGTVIGS